MNEKPCLRSIAPSLTDPADHLALDEALLLGAGEDDGCETLRIWEFTSPVVVVGRASRVDVEVDHSFCQSNEIAVIRRCSGGASVVGGPGCLMYSIALNLQRNPQLRKIDVAHQYVMQRILAAVRKQLPEVAFQGTCDLTWRDCKCSGNSLRIARQSLLYHGTILYDADLDLIADCLKEAPRQPQYRRGRDHRGFITNIPVDPAGVAADIQAAFGAEPDSQFALPHSRIRELRQQRYDDPGWHFRH